VLRPAFVIPRPDPDPDPGCTGFTVMSLVPTVNSVSSEHPWAPQLRFVSAFYTTRVVQGPAGFVAKCLAPSMLAVLRTACSPFFRYFPCTPQDPRLPDIAGSSVVMPPSAEEMAALGSQRSSEVRGRPPLLSLFAAWHRQTAWHRPHTCIPVSLHGDSCICNSACRCAAGCM